MEFGFKGKSSLRKLFDLLVFFPLDQNGAASLTQCFVLVKQNILNYFENFIYVFNVFLIHVHTHITLPSLPMPLPPQPLSRL